VVVGTAPPNPGAVWTGGGAVAHTTGRVFFTTSAGAPGWCSGAAVTSANRSVVVTAGHCLKHGGWSTKVAFVPGYRNGMAPHGTWTSSKLMAPPQWVSTEAVAFDLGAAVLNPLDGRRLTDVVGGHGVAFNQARGELMHAFGYPAQSPYTGDQLVYCSGKVLVDWGHTDAHGMNCTMTAGSDGGPWFLRFAEDSGTGVLNSVTSFQVRTATGLVCGPYFGAEAQNLYNAAQAA
jgi:V8-like Glu-specific endopeptidase